MIGNYFTAASHFIFIIMNHQRIWGHWLHYRVPYICLLVSAPKPLFLWCRGSSRLLGNSENTDTFIRHRWGNRVQPWYSLISIRQNYYFDMFSMIWHEIVCWLLKIYQDLRWFAEKCSQNCFCFDICCVEQF